MSLDTFPSHQLRFQQADEKLGERQQQPIHLSSEVSSEYSQVGFSVQYYFSGSWFTESVVLVQTWWCLSPPEWTMHHTLQVLRVSLSALLWGQPCFWCKGGSVKNRFRLSLSFSYAVKPKVVFLIVLYSLPRSSSHKHIICLSHT